MDQENRSDETLNTRTLHSHASPVQRWAVSHGLHMTIAEEAIRLSENRSA